MTKRRKDGKPTPMPTLSRARASQSPVYDALDAICAHIEEGTPVDVAAELEGVTGDALAARRRDVPEVEERIRRARAIGEAGELKRLRALTAGGAPTGGQTWLMERLYPKRYHLPSKVQVSGDDEAGPVRQEIKLTLVEATALARGDDK